MNYGNHDFYSHTIMSIVSLSLLSQEKLRRSFWSCGANRTSSYMPHLTKMGFEPCRVADGHIKIRSVRGPRLSLEKGLALCVLSAERTPRLFSLRSTSPVIPTPAPSWRRPRPGHPGRLSTSLTTVATTSSDSATHAKPACPTQTCWRWAGRESKCGTAPATAPAAAPPTVSGDS